MKYGVLNQKNPAYRPDLWAKLDDLYEGGFRILERAREYIKRQVNEETKLYEQRLAHAEYVNYLGMVVDAYAANLFAQEPVVSSEKGDVDAFWAEFSKDANLKGDDFSRVMRDVFTTAVLKRRCYIACDFPATDTVPETRAEEDALGKTRGYAFELCPEELVDWEYGDVVKRSVTLKDGAKVQYAYGLLKWAILRREVCTRETPEDDRDTFVEEFRVWKLVGDGVAAWTLYRTKPRRPTDAAPGDDVVLDLAGEGVTTFRQIPIVEMCIPPGLWLGNKLGPLALALFRRRSSLVASEDRSLFPVAVFKAGPEVSAPKDALPPELQQNPHRGTQAHEAARNLGAVQIGHQDDFDFVEPAGHVHELVEKQLAGAVDEFFRVAHMMASSISSTSTALGRSGVSKEQDYRAMAIVLEAYGAIVKDAAIRVHDVIAEARGERIEWRVSGLDKFDVVDRAIVLEEAKSLSLVTIPSKTFNAHWKTKVALALLGNTTPELQRAIEEEIESGIQAEELMTDLLRMPDDDAEAEDVAREGPRAAGGSEPPTPRASHSEGAPPR